MPYEPYRDGFNKAETARVKVSSRRRKKDSRKRLYGLAAGGVAGTGLGHGLKKLKSFKGIKHVRKSAAFLGAGLGAGLVKRFAKKTPPTPAELKGRTESNRYYSNFDDSGDWISGTPQDKYFKKKYGKKT